MEYSVVAWIGLPGWAELAIVAFLALLLFGKRLPLLARAIGQTVVEFRRGLGGDNTAN